MRDYYKVRIQVVHEHDIEVVATNQNEARQHAQKAPVPAGRPLSTSVGVVSARRVSACDYDVGTRIKHFLFGRGKIESLVRTTNGNNEFGHGATIVFDDGETRQISLPMVRKKLEILAG